MKKNIVSLIICCLCAMTMFGQAYPDRHSMSFTDAWVSCEETESPNIKRDPGHWIMYNFGDQYSLHHSKIWNYNVPDSTSRGMQDIAVDYSNDGETWIELGEFTLPEAPGSAFYQGDEGPNFDGIVARYVLISILSNHGDATCTGMSEIRIDATVATSTNIPKGDLDVTLAANPNPAREFTTIVVGDIGKDLQYSLFDMTGRLIRQGKVNAKEFTLNTSTLASGTYTLSVHNAEGQKAIMLNIIGE